MATDDSPLGHGPEAQKKAIKQYYELQTRKRQEMQSHWKPGLKVESHDALTGKDIEEILPF